MDSGLSARELKKRIALAGLDSSRLKAILVSHEHRDHIAGVAVAARALNAPVYLNQDTLRRAAWAMTGSLDLRSFDTGRPFALGALTIHPISLSHDAADPVGFIFETADGARLGHATDLGTSTHLVRDHLRRCHGLILEFNHDLRMLMEGPYPWDLKTRVRGRRGHLSNEQGAELLSFLSHTGLQAVVLAHLSETNNQPELALEAARAAVSQPPFELLAARQSQPGPVIEIIGK